VLYVLWRQRTPDLDESEDEHRRRVDDRAAVDLGQRREDERASLQTTNDVPKSACVRAPLRLQERAERLTPTPSMKMEKDSV
jgi:hypothetical protein